MTQTKITPSQLNLPGIIYVDGIKYPQSYIGVSGAFAALPASGGKVILCPGGFPSSITSIIPNFTHLQGSGRGNTYLYADTATSGGVLGGELLYSVNKSGITISDLTLDGSSLNGSGASILHFLSGTDCTVQNIEYRNGPQGSNGVKFKSCTRPSISDSHFENCYQDSILFTNCVDISAGFNEIHLQNGSLTDPAIGVYSSNTQDARYGNVVGNRIFNASGTGISLEDSTDITVVANTIRNAYNGIVVQSTSFTASDHIIGDNKIINSRNNSGAGIIVGGDRCSLSNNQIRGGSGDGIRVDGDYCNLSNNHAYNNKGNGLNLNAVDFCSLSSNHAVGNSLRGIAMGTVGHGWHTLTANQCIANGFDGILVNLQSGCTLTANICMNNSQAASNTYNGITLNGANYIIMNGNQCSDNQGSPTQRRGISDGGSGSNYNTYKNNATVGNVTGSILHAGANDIIGDNQV